MVIDYSKWDNLKLSSDEEDSDDDNEEVAVSNGLSQGRSRNVSTVESSSLSGLTKKQLDHIPRIVLLVRSTFRDSILQQITEHGIEHASPFGKFGISLLSSFYLDSSSFCSFIPGIQHSMLRKIQAAIMRMTLDQYDRDFGNRSDFRHGMGGVPYDAQFLGDPFADGSSALHVRYGQERQGLYKHVAGPEFKVCKMGSSCGGPVVLIQAEMKDNGFVESYMLKKIEVAESDIPQVVSELLAKPENEYAY